jgi:phosphate/sulfate permease
LDDLFLIFAEKSLFFEKRCKKKGDHMTKKDLIRKLTSRKFASALLGFITAVLIAFKMSENDIAQIVAIIGSFLTLISYILAEGQIDAAAISQAKEEPDSQKEEEGEL